MKYLKMVIRLVLFIAISPIWIWILMFVCIGETIVIFVNWLNDTELCMPYNATRCVFEAYKWVRGG